MDVEILKERKPLWVMVLEENYKVENMQPTTQTSARSILRKDLKNIYGENEA